MLPRSEADNLHAKQSLGEDVKLPEDHILPTRDDKDKADISCRTECDTNVSSRAKGTSKENTDLSKLILIVKGTTYFVSKSQQKQLRHSSSRTEWQQTLPR